MVLFRPRFIGSTSNLRYSEYIHHQSVLNEANEANDPERSKHFKTMKCPMKIYESPTHPTCMKKLERCHEMS